MIKDQPLTKIDKNNRAFAYVWIVFQIFFCFMYGFFGRTASYDIYLTNGLREYLACVGIAIATVIGLGGIMSYIGGLKWSGFGFALLITALCYQYYFLINAFWTKIDIQRTFADVNNVKNQDEQVFGTTFLIWVSQAYGTVYRTFGCTATGAFKMALSLTIAFSAFVGRAGPLQILTLVLVGGFFYELNRQVIVQVNYDIGGSITIFMFGGILGSVASVILAVKAQKAELIKRANYTSSRFNSTVAMLGSAFFWVFYPTIFYDVPNVNSKTEMATNLGPFLDQNGMISAYFAISASVVTSLAMSGIIHRRIRIKDLMYGTFAGAAIVGTSAPHIFSPTGAIVLGMIAGLLQPFFNIIEEKIANSEGGVKFSTCAPFLFAVQGLLGSLAAGIFRAISNNATHRFNPLQYPYPFRWQQAGEYYRATFISFGIAIGAGAIVGGFLIFITAQQSKDYFEDVAYWVVRDDGLREQRGDRTERKEDEDIKGNNAYLKN